jgi:hypothetical protein
MVLFREMKDLRDEAGFEATSGFSASSAMGSTTLSCLVGDGEREDGMDGVEGYHDRPEKRREKDLEGRLLVEGEVAAVDATLAVESRTEGWDVDTLTGALSSWNEWLLVRTGIC